MDLNSIMQVAGIGGKALGAVGDVIGAFGQKKEAKKQLQMGQQLAAQQKLDFQGTYSDLLGMAQNQATYKGDISGYQRAEKEAERQQIMAGTVPVSDQLYREQAGRTSANTFARGARGAKSGTDLMALAGLAGAQENQQLQGINIDTANRMQTNQQQANQSRISTIAQTAAAQARERGLEFQSLMDKAQNIQGLTREKGLGGMELNYQLKQDEFARRGAVQDARSAIYSGFGDIFRSIGGGIAQNNMQNQQMKMFETMYPKGSANTSNNYGNPSSWNQAFDTGIRKDLMGFSKGIVSQPVIERPKPKGFNPDGTYKY